MAFLDFLRKPKKFKVDPALEAQLKKRGMEDKLRELEMIETEILKADRDRQIRLAEEAGLGPPSIVPRAPKGAFEIEIGAGLTPEQKGKAQEVIRKQITASQKQQQAKKQRRITRLKRAVEPITGVAAPPVKVARGVGGIILRIPQRVVTGVALELPAAILGVEPVFRPTSKFEKFAFGDEPIVGIFKRGEDIAAFLNAPGTLKQKIFQSLGIKQDIDPENLPSGIKQAFNSIVLSPLLLGGLTGLDLSPIGGGKKVGGKLFKNLVTKYGDETAQLIANRGKDFARDALKANANDVNNLLKGEAKAIQKLPTLNKAAVQSKEVLEGSVELSRKTGLPTAGNIRLDKFDAPDEVLNLIQRTADEITQPVVRSTDELLQSISESVGIKPEKLIRRFERQGILSDIDLGVLDNSLNEQARKVIDLTKQFQANRLDLQLGLRLAGEKELMTALQQTATGARVAAGRSVQQFKNIRKFLESPEENLARIQKILGEDFAKFADQLATLDLDDPLVVKRFLASAGKPTIADKILEFRTAMLLTKPSTQLVNLAGNTLFGFIQPFIKGAAALSESFATIGGIRRQREVFFGEVLADILGKKRGLTIAAKTVAKASDQVQQAVRAEGGFIAGTRAGIQKISDILDNVDFKRIEFEEIRPNSIQGKLGKVIRAPFTLLGLGDEFGKTVNTSAEIQSLAFRKAAQQGGGFRQVLERTQDIINNIEDHPDILKNAALKAEELLFRGKAGKTEAALLNLRNKGGPVAKFLFPFLKTPIQIAKQGIRLTPSGFISAAKATGRERALLIGQASFGSSIMTGAAMLALEDKVTGRAPIKKKDRDAFFREGKQPYSVFVNGQWIDYSRIEPLSIALGVAADLVETFKETGEVPSTKLLQEFATSIGQNLTNKTYLRGMKDLFEALSTPGEEGVDLLARAFASFVPNIAAGVARGIDPVLRDPKGVLETVQSKIPGMTKGLIPRRNAFGEPIEFEGGILNSLFSIVRVTKPEDDIVEQKLKEAGVTIGFPSKTQGKVKLNDLAYDRFLRDSGQDMKATLEKVLTNPAFDALDESTKQDVINKIIKDGRNKFKGDAILDTTLVNFDIDPQEAEGKREVLKEVVTNKAFRGLDENKQEIVINRLLTEGLEKENNLEPERISEIPVGAKVFRMPDSLGGGEFVTLADGTPAILDRNVPDELKEQIRAENPDKTSVEVDHIISLRLGGTNNETNLQALESRKSLLQRAKEVITGRKTNTKEYRQEGKWAVETLAIRQLKAGLISLSEARAAVLNWNNRPENFLAKNKSGELILATQPEKVTIPEIRQLTPEEIVFAGT